MSTTKPVVADSVMVSAVLERQPASALVAVSTTATTPSGFRNDRTVAKADAPSGNVISSVPAAAPKVVSGCDGPSKSMRGRPTCLRIVRHGGDDPAVGIGDQDLPVAVCRPDRQRVLDRRRGAAGVRPYVSCRTIELKREIVGERLDCLSRFNGRLPALLEHLNGGADTDRDAGRR